MISYPVWQSQPLPLALEPRGFSQMRQEASQNLHILLTNEYSYYYEEENSARNAPYFNFGVTSCTITRYRFSYGFSAAYSWLRFTHFWLDLRVEIYRVSLLELRKVGFKSFMYRNENKQ